MSDLYYNEESYYSEENTCNSKAFPSTILQLLQFEPEQKKICGNESHEKETKLIHALAANLLHTRIGNFKGSTKEVDFHLWESARLLATCFVYRALSN